jgi:peptidoglycan hydrolase FlgJ
VSRPPIAAVAIDEGRVANGHVGPTREVASTANAAKTAEAFRQFEAFVLQSFIETMLPKNAETVFGKGTAGTVWKSMLAEKLADQISRSGGVGIAQRIAAVSNTEVAPTSLDAGQSASKATRASVSLRSTREQRGDDA